MALYFVSTGHFELSLSRVFAVLLSIVIPSLGEERAGQCAFRAFAYFARVNFSPFSLPLGVKNWLRFVIVTLSGLFC